MTLSECTGQVWEQASQILAGDRPQLPSVDISRFERARRAYLGEASRRPVYGYCTGLGELYNVRLEECPRGWEEVVVEEHSAQLGRPAGERIVRLFMLVRLHQLNRAPAPVRPEVAERLRDALTLGLTPVVYTRGSVGASGDLSPSAQLVRCLYYGRGIALLRGERLPCSEALSRAGLGPLPLDRGEALFLINNTAWSTALCMASTLVAGRLLEESVRALERVVRLARASWEHYEDKVLQLKNCPEGARVALRLRDSAAREPRSLQAPYSIRCAPQLLGVVARSIEIARTLLAEEACAATENPVLAGGRVYHACNFHSAKVGLACSVLGAGLTILSQHLERVGAQILRHRVTGLPEHLAGEGSSVGAMIAHYTMAALSAGARVRLGGALQYNTPTSGLQEDIVPMSPEAALGVLEAERAIALQLAALTTILDRAEELDSGRRGPLLGLQERLEARAREVWRRVGLDLLD